MPHFTCMTNSLSEFHWPIASQICGFCLKTFPMITFHPGLPLTSVKLYFGHLIWSFHTVRNATTKFEEQVCLQFSEYMFNELMLLSKVPYVIRNSVKKVREMVKATFGSLGL